MRAVDTNIIVRYLMGDDPEQSPTAHNIVEAGEIFVPKTVLLETAWVLSSLFKIPDEELLSLLRKFVGMPRVSLENRHEIMEALEMFAAGYDFADALHLAAARECETFLTFDRGFVRAARRGGSTSVKLA